MASSVVASKRAPLAVAGLLKQLLLAAPSASGAAPAAAAAALRPVSVLAARRLFSTSATPVRRDYDDYSGSEEYSGDKEGVYGRIRSPRGFTKVADPCACSKPTCVTCPRQLLEEEAAPTRGCEVLGAVWGSKEDADAVNLKVAMPGLGKEHVKVWADQNDLVIEGKGDKDTEFDDDEDPTAWHGHRIEFPADTFKMDQIGRSSMAFKMGRRTFSSGGVPPRSSDDAEDAAAAAAFAALFFSDEEEYRSGVEFRPDGDVFRREREVFRGVEDTDDEEEAFRSHPRCFTVWLPPGAVCKSKVFADEAKLKVAMPGLAKDQMFTFRPGYYKLYIIEGDDDSASASASASDPAEDIHNLYLEELPLPPPPPPPPVGLGMDYDADIFRMHDIEIQKNNGILSLTIHKIIKSDLIEGQLTEEPEYTFSNLDQEVGTCPRSRTRRSRSSKEGNGWNQSVRFS